VIAIGLFAVVLGTVTFAVLVAVGGRDGGVRVAAHRCSTAHLQAAYPFMSEGGLGGRGVYIGQEVLGGSFTFDPWELYSRNLLTNPNMVVAGQVGRGKSSLVKTLLWRQQAFGRRAAIMDPKGEYQELASALGVEVLRLAPGSGVRLNPLDPGPGAADLAPEEVERRQLALLQSLAGAAMRRDLASEEGAACGLALRGLAEKGVVVPTLPQIVEVLLEPTKAMASAVRTTPADLARASRDVALELRRLCEGDLRGMFDGDTSIDVDWEGPAVVLDLSELFHSDALGMLMTCATAWLQAAIARPGAGKRIIVVDEAWAILNNVRIARWLRSSFKLSRAFGVSNIAVIHRLSDLQAAGAEGSEAVSLAKGLLSDAETRVVYCQPPNEVGPAVDLLGLSDTEASLLPVLGRGVALWKVGQRAYLVEHHLGEGERAIVDTDARMVAA
jgi:hypothetical protein